MDTDHKVIHIAERRNTGRERFLARLFEDHQVALRRFLRMRLVPAQEREDLLQDLFVRLAALPDVEQRLSQKPESVQSYLFSIVVNLITDRARRDNVRNRSRHESLTDSHHNIPCDISPEQQFAMERELAIIREKLNKMEVKQRNIFVLNRFRGLSYPEIAEHMGVSVSWVEKCISNALHTLRKGTER